MHKERCGLIILTDYVHVSKKVYLCYLQRIRDLCHIKVIRVQKRRSKYNGGYACVCVM